MEEEITTINQIWKGHQVGFRSNPKLRILKQNSERTEESEWLRMWTTLNEDRKRGWEIRAFKTNLVQKQEEKQMLSDIKKVVVDLCKTLKLVLLQKHFRFNQLLNTNIKK